MAAPAAASEIFAAAPRVLTSFEVWSFNLRTEFCDAADGPDGWSQRRGLVVDFIRARRPALLCVQEATEAMLSFLAEGLAEYGWRGTSRTPGRADEMAGFLYDRRRLEAVEYCASWLGPPGAPAGQACWDAAYPRTTEALVFRIRGQGSAKAPVHLRAVNTHLDHVGVEARRRSAELLAESVERGAAEWPGCVQVLCGDFNSPKAGGNRVYELLTAGRTGLRDAAREAGKRSLVRSTIHKFEGTAFAAKRGDGTVDLTASAASPEDAQHIDWVLYRDSERLRLRPARCEVITEALPSGRYPSDHFPVSVTFALAEA